jgi:predicted metal-binding membrane protein
MSVRLNEGKAITLRAIVAAGCLGAILFAVVLSAIPQLHERIHDATGAPNHECAVTLLTSGNYQHTPTVTIALAPPAPPIAFAHTFRSFRLVSAHLEFSLLEHAPPAIS